MKRIINKRLEMISAFCKDNDRIIDIGCDHGLLGIYLVLNRNNIKIVGSDINTGPLEKAKDNLLKYHLEDKIELRLGDGLNTVSDDIDTIIISGMGGITIVGILKTIDNYPNIQRLILSPNNDFPFVRKEICRLGFKINQEVMVEEKGKYYSIMEFIKGKEEINPFFGKLDLTTPVVRDYYIKLYKKNKEIISKRMNDKLCLDNKMIEDILM